MIYHHVGGPCVSSADLSLHHFRWRQGTIDMSVANTGKRIDYCAICEIAAFCLYRLMRSIDDGPCGLFEGSAHVVTAPRDSAAGRDVKGLCENCENRDSCLLPKADGGVWHCEEYR